MEWRPVVGYEGIYEASESGDIRSVDRIDSAGRPRRGKVLRLQLSMRGDYQTVTLSKHGRMRTYSVHRLIAEAFHGERPAGMEVRHLNGDGLDNRSVNLAWGTHTANVGDTLQHGTHNHARKTHCIRDHEFTPENTYVWRDPKTGQTSRICRTCQRMRQAGLIRNAA